MYILHALFVFATIASCTATSRDLLVNIPAAGDAMLLTQPTYEYSPEGPGTLKEIYRWQHDRRDGEFDLGLTPDEIKFDSHPPLQWDQVVAAPPEPPAPVGKSEERPINYAMVCHQPLWSPSLLVLTQLSSSLLSSATSTKRSAKRARWTRHERHEL